MLRNLTIVQVIFFFALSSVSHADSNHTLFYSPDKNSIQLEQQKIDYDLTKETTLRLGPYLLNETTVSISLTREVSEFSNFIISFRWPTDFIQEGFLELINERGQVLWSRRLTEKNILNWQKQIELFKVSKSTSEHVGSQYGLANQDFLKIPVTSITEPFRYCLTDEQKNGRLAVCSKTYQFQRVGGQLQISAVKKNIYPQVRVNDKPVTNKGTAIFLENKIPIKFSAMLKSGTYFEFVSNPKDIFIVELTKDEAQQKIVITGFGDLPMEPIDESFVADSSYWSRLNFSPTTGDLRKFWRIKVPQDNPYLYLKGEGGAPFRQGFIFNNLPSLAARIVIDKDSPRSTYSSVLRLRGQADKSLVLSSKNTIVKRLEGNNFEWEFLSPKRNANNVGWLEVVEKDQKWLADYEVYRGFPGELSARLTAVLNDDAEFLFVSEYNGQYWFESIFGSQNKLLSRQRWGVAFNQYDIMSGSTDAIKEFGATTADLKYRLTPGVWGREPTMGLVLSYMSFRYSFQDNVGRADYEVPVAGVGAFWARSMPKLLDDIFNLAPFLRYPKWVDWEVIYYPLALGQDQTAQFMLTSKIHAKIQWTPRFFGEIGFNFRNYSFKDLGQTNPNDRLGISIGAGFTSLGFGFNF
jgi:hypothetical protein